MILEKCLRVLSFERERERERDRQTDRQTPEILLYLKKQFLDETRSWQVVSACNAVNKLLLLSQKLNKQGSNTGFINYLRR